jgi:hypothetical protein
VFFRESKVFDFLAGIITTSGVGGPPKHVVKLLPGQIQSIAQKLTPQQRMNFLKQQQQQRLQAQRQQQSQAASQPSQAQAVATTTVEAAPKSASPVSLALLARLHLQL